MNARTKKTPLHTPREVKAVTAALSELFKNTPQRRVRSLKTRVEIAQVAIETLRKLEARRQPEKSDLGEVYGRALDTQQEVYDKKLRDQERDYHRQICTLKDEIVYYQQKKSTEVPSPDRATRQADIIPVDLSDEEIVKAMSLNPGGRVVGKPKPLFNLEEAAKPLMKFLCDNYHPHVKVIVEPNRAELLEGQMTVINNEFIKD